MWPKKEIVAVGAITIAALLILLVAFIASKDQPESEPFPPDTEPTGSIMLATLLPHLEDKPDSLQPSYLIRSNKSHVDIVIGITHARRQQGNYLFKTLESMLDVISAEDKTSVLVLTMIAETDNAYVENITKSLNERYESYIAKGFLEVIAPHHSFYPAMDKELTIIEDTQNQSKLMTKQNLDRMYLMAYSQERSTHYLMLEDDIIAKPNFLKEIKKFMTMIEISNPDYIFIKFLAIGVNGTLFTNKELPPFIIYLQRFFKEMPIDLILEMYLRDRVCSPEMSAKQCIDETLKVRPFYTNGNIFRRIESQSSLKEKLLMSITTFVLQALSPKKGTQAENISVSEKQITN